MVAVALAVRLIPVLRGGGLFGTMAYDDGVYFGSASRCSTGASRIATSCCCHPPGILVVLAPFAALGHLVGDPTGFAAARLAFMVLGAVNVVLVTLVASRAGRRAALAAGALYVVWEVAANVERTTWLVAPQSTLLLLALLALAGPRDRPASWVPSLRRCAVAGVLLGLNVGLQVWGVVPLAIVLAWLVAIHRRRFRAAVRPVLATGIGAAVAIADRLGAVPASSRARRWSATSSSTRPVAPSRAPRSSSGCGTWRACPLHHGLGPWVPSVLVIGAFVCRGRRRCLGGPATTGRAALDGDPGRAGRRAVLRPAARPLRGLAGTDRGARRWIRRRHGARGRVVRRRVTGTSVGLRGRPRGPPRRVGGPARRRPALARTVSTRSSRASVRDRRLADAPDRDGGARPVTCSRAAR